jgi:hypothetical protein
MLDLILPFITDRAARALPPYQIFLKDQKTFVYDRYRRLQGMFGHESPGVKLLRYILQFVDIDYLQRQANNYQRYLNHLRYIRKDLTEIFDRDRRGRGYFELFFHTSDRSTEEFLLPVQDVNSISVLPLHTNNWNEWKYVKPLRVWSHDSQEYSIKIINDYIQYKHSPPSYVIELLDVVALVFKYYIWYTYERDNEPAQELAQHAPQQLFLHKYVMCDTVWDLTDIWLLNKLNLLMDQSERLQVAKFDSSSITADYQWGWIAMTCRRGFESIWDLLYDIRKNIQPESLLSSKILTSGSINDRIRYTDRELVLPYATQYDWYRYLRDKDIVKFFVKLWRTRPELPTSKRMMYNLSRDYKRMLLRQPWNQCLNVALKEKIHNEMLALDRDLSIY